MVNKMKSVQHERLQRALLFGLLKKKNSLGFPFLFFNGAFTRMLDSETSLCESSFLSPSSFIFSCYIITRFYLKIQKIIFMVQEQA